MVTATSLGDPTLIMKWKLNVVQATLDSRQLEELTDMIRIMMPQEWLRCMQCLADPSLTMQLFRSCPAHRLQHILQVSGQVHQQHPSAIFLVISGGICTYLDSIFGGQLAGSARDQRVR